MFFFVAGSTEDLQVMKDILMLCPDVPLVIGRGLRCNMMGMEIFCGLTILTTIYNLFLIIAGAFVGYEAGRVLLVVVEACTEIIGLLDKVGWESQEFCNLQPVDGFTKAITQFAIKDEFLVF